VVTASADYTGDLRVWDDVIKANVESYRRLRNTIRFMLANLSGFNEKERIDHSEMPELERYMLARLAALDALVRDGYAHYDFNRVFTALFAFCTNDLSAFYFDIRKDSLYCDRADSIRRRSARTTTDEIFRRVVTWFAPILCFTMEEAWLSRFPAGESVHLQVFPDAAAEWRDEGLIRKWDRVRDLRRVVTGALEIKRKDKVIGASLEARPVLFVTPEDAALLDGIDLGEIAITSHAMVSSHDAPEEAFRLPDVAGAAAVFHHAEGDKCARCWMILPEVGRNPTYPDLCNRCADAVEALDRNR
jgi:isoleucyl-tRNA synthetase